MLELRPTCENCNRTLPPASDLAMICSFECTFCKHCVDEILANVCPNCGGGPVARAGGQFGKCGRRLGRGQVQGRHTRAGLDKGIDPDRAELAARAGDDRDASVQLKPVAHDRASCESATAPMAS